MRTDFALILVMEETGSLYTMVKEMNEYATVVDYFSDGAVHLITQDTKTRCEHLQRALDMSETSFQTEDGTLIKRDIKDLRNFGENIYMSKIDLTVFTRTWARLSSSFPVTNFENELCVNSEQSTITLDLSADPSGVHILESDNPDFTNDNEQRQLTTDGLLEDYYMTSEMDDNKWKVEYIISGAGITCYKTYIPKYGQVEDDGSGKYRYVFLAPLTELITCITSENFAPKWY